MLINVGQWEGQNHDKNHHAYPLLIWIELYLTPECYSRNFDHSSLWWNRDLSFPDDFRAQSSVWCCRWSLFIYYLRRSMSICGPIYVKFHRWGMALAGLVERSANTNEVSSLNNVAKILTRKIWAGDENWLKYRVSKLFDNFRTEETGLTFQTFWILVVSGSILAVAGTVTFCLHQCKIQNQIRRLRKMTDLATTDSKRVTLHKAIESAIDEARFAHYCELLEGNRNLITSIDINFPCWFQSSALILSSWLNCLLTWIS